jgi:hypothetical protein
VDLIGGATLPIAWTVLGGTIVVCGLRARHSPRAYAVGIAAVSVLWVLAGAAANAAMLIDGTTYTGFATGSPIPSVRDTWESLVVPHHHVFIGLLVAGEALAGALVLVPGRVREVVLLCLVAFNATLVVFGWAFAIWAVPLVASLLLLHRAQRLDNQRLDNQRLRNRPRRPSGDASSGRPRSPRSRVPSP